MNKTKSPKRLITISLPIDLIAQADALSVREDRSRSAVMRRALVDYMSRHLEEVKATAGEERLLSEGRRAYRAGEGEPLNDVLHELNLLDIAKGKKTTRKTREKTA